MMMHEQQTLKLQIKQAIRVLYNMTNLSGWQRLWPLQFSQFL